MKPTQQRKSYDCFDACVASLLELPIEDMPGIRYLFDDDKRTWEQGWEDFLNARNLTMICMDAAAHREALREMTLRGYAIATVKGRRGANHAVVLRDGKQVWDPWPGDDEPYPVESWITVEVFQVLDPSKPISMEVAE